MKLKAYAITHRMGYGQYQLLSSTIPSPGVLFAMASAFIRTIPAMHNHLKLHAIDLQADPINVFD